MRKLLLALTLVLGFATSAFATTPTGLKTSPYQAAVNDCVLVGLNHSTNVTIFAPNGTPTNGAEFEVVIVSDTTAIDGGGGTGPVCVIEATAGSLMSVEGPRAPDYFVHVQVLWNVGDSMKFRYVSADKTWRLVADGRSGPLNTRPRIAREYCVPRPNEFIVCRSTLGAFTVDPWAYDANGRGSWAIGDTLTFKMDNYSGVAVTIRFGVGGTGVTIHGDHSDSTDSVTLNSGGETVVATYRGDSNWDCTIDTR